VSRFIDNAERILEAAELVRDSGSPQTDWTIVIGREGEIRLVADSDWPLDALEHHHGAAMVYRVEQTAGRVRVLGRAGSRVCTFESERPETVARRLLPDRREYYLLPAA
jgi:hypothetical protein